METGTVGGRLLEAITRKLGSVRRFERALIKGAPDLRGTSRQTLYRYFKGEVEPSAGVISAAAALLEVREAWLARGEGEMTEEEEREAQRLRRSARRRVDVSDDGLFEAVSSAVPDLAELSPAVGVALMAHVLRWERARKRFRLAADREGYARDVWKYLEYPLSEWAAALPQELVISPTALGDYAMAMIHGLDLSLQILERVNLPIADEDS